MKHSAVVFFALVGAAIVAHAQTITDFTPRYGSPGDTIRLDGSGFTANTVVRFWNNQVASRYVNSSTVITATVPAGATTGLISVQGGGSPNYHSASFTVIGAGPCIVGVSPTFGAVGDTVLITGVHFRGATQVRFGSRVASFTMNDSGTEISATVPVGATNAPISVTTAAGTSNSPTAFTVIGPGPYISGFSPYRYDGAVVFISGRFFSGTTALLFNGTNAAWGYVSSDAVIQALPAANVSTGPITVITPLGTNISATNFYVSPVITGVSPASGRSGTNVTLIGRNFIGTTSVLFNGLPAAFDPPTNNGTLQVRVPAGATTGRIQLDAPGGSYPTSSNFVVQPNITGFTPGFGPVGTVVTISGANLDVGTPTVKFGGVPASIVTNKSFGQLTAVVPAGATNAPLTVTTTDGSATSTATFYLPPAISSFTPTNSLPGTTVTITGQNLLGATYVSFNATPASFAPTTNNTTIYAVVPVGFATGPLVVSTPGGTTNSGGKLFYAPPEISGFSPTHGLPGTNVVIAGANLLGTTAVRFNGLTANFTPPTNNTTLVATVPANATTGPITVAAPAGTNTSAGVFTLDYTADLSVTVTDSPDPVFAGSNLVYSIHVLNMGPFAAPDAVLSNTLPTSVTLKGATSTAGSLDTSGNPIIASFGTLHVGASVTVTLTVAPQTVGWITNTATASSGYSDPVSADSTVTTPTFVQPLPLLSIRHPQTDRVRVSWPVALSNFTLQYLPAFSGTDYWSNVTTTASPVADENVVTETNTEPARFYRLKK